MKHGFSSAFIEYNIDAAIQKLLIIVLDCYITKGIRVYYILPETSASAMECCSSVRV